MRRRTSSFSSDLTFEAVELLGHPLAKLLLFKWNLLHNSIVTTARHADVFQLIAADDADTRDSLLYSGKLIVRPGDAAKGGAVAVRTVPCEKVIPSGRKESGLREYAAIKGVLVVVVDQRRFLGPGGDQSSPSELNEPFRRMGGEGHELYRRQPGEQWRLSSRSGGRAGGGLRIPGAINQVWGGAKT